MAELWIYWWITIYKTKQILGVHMIDIKQKVSLGNFMQKIHIKSLDENNPVLLFLHGGPGVCNRHSIMTQHTDLLDTFTLVAWDQRGSGGSYHGVDVKDLTIAQMVEDAKQLVSWLCERFKKDKIFVIGGSWGSELGIWLSYKHPEQIAAFVGFGQVVNGALNEEISYKFALECAQKANDEKAVSKLLNLGAPVNGVYKGGYDGMMIQRKIMMKYGGYSKDKAKRSYFKATVLPMLFSGEYSISDIYGLIIGHKLVLETMLPEVGMNNFTKTCPNFSIPILIFDGVHDQNTPAELVEDYFNLITAPQKELIWFEHSGHNPMSDEPDKFKNLLREKLNEIKKTNSEKGVKI